MKTEIAGELAGGKVEAPIGVEPMNRGFAIRSLSHLGTAPEFLRPPLNHEGFGQASGFDMMGA